MDIFSTNLWILLGLLIIFWMNENQILASMVNVNIWLLSKELKILIGYIGLKSINIQDKAMPKVIGTLALSFKVYPKV